MLTDEDRVTLSYAKQSGNSLMRQMVELVERLINPPENFLICKSCGADRIKEECKGEISNCSMQGIAHGVKLY